VGVSESPGGTVRLEFFNGEWEYCGGPCGGVAIVAGEQLAVPGGVPREVPGGVPLGNGSGDSYTRRFCLGLDHGVFCHGSHAQPLTPFFNQKKFCLHPPSLHKTWPLPHVPSFHFPHA
jgi:hypothetical protein